ncbi:MAG: biotin--[acetyl-CoA-carboxylase] ligase [Propionibacteriaceae bacterium]|jgi:BirA family biotin operon repressor/biotin-[acetyl-CoA-carboxylase] ligase|nr:biotin--[acetyl-CoA-carboxylase] ligase [Propionibacteriaceae bacterium]
MTDPLDADRLLALLAGTPWGPVAVVGRTGSTNADLSAALRSGRSQAGAVVVAAEQSAGRGRLDRAWSSPGGKSVALSAAVRPPAAARWSLLPLVAGLAVADAVAELGATPELKWPNDVLIAGRKVCGVLAETCPVAAGLVAVVGIGLNVSQGADELPFPDATSLALEGVAASRERAAAAVLGHLSRHLAQWGAGEPVVDRYRARSATLGRAVRLTLAPGRAVTGVATGLAPDGRLGVTVDGVEAWFAAGDVRHLRPTTSDAALAEGRGAQSLQGCPESGEGRPEPI